MWFKRYRDYPPDGQVIKEQVWPTHGIIGCEMHERYGWGTSYHVARKKKHKRGVFNFFKRKQDD